MGRFFKNHPLLIRMSTSINPWVNLLSSKLAVTPVNTRNGKTILTSFIFALVISSISQTAQAEVLNIPIKRSVATQPISTLEVVSAVKNLFNGRVLSLRKKSTYTNPDCYHVKFLEDRGEFKLITIGCGMQKMAKS